MYITYEIKSSIICLIGCFDAHTRVLTSSDSAINGRNVAQPIASHIIIVTHAMRSCIQFRIIKFRVVMLWRLPVLVNTQWTSEEFQKIACKLFNIYSIYRIAVTKWNKHSCSSIYRLFSRRAGEAKTREFLQGYFSNCRKTLNSNSVSFDAVAFD